MLPTGQGGGASHQRGDAFPTPVGRLYGFPTGESPVVKVLYKTGAFYQLKGAVPPQRSGASYLPRAEALNPPVRRSRSQAEPLAPRAVRPGGAINPRGEAASTLGITASRRIPHKSPSSTNVAHSKKALTITVSAFSVNQQLPILPGRFQPSTFGVCELNYRVRHGYGCILTAIATESLRVCSLKTA